VTAARVWITDGSLPRFSDTTKLAATHAAAFGFVAAYEGAVDPDVPVGSVELRAQRLDDALFAEAEWCVGFPDGPPDELTAETEIVVQGIVEGKWLNRLLETRAWQPASIGNNLLAAGPGITTTVGGLAATDGHVRVSFPGGTHISSLADLRGHNIRGLLEAVIATENGLDWIDLGAFGERAATVNERARLKAAASPFPHKAKEKLVRQALEDEAGVPAGADARLVVVDGHGNEVGAGSLVWRALDVAR
jgi:hypothetical protein